MVGRGRLQHAGLQAAPQRLLVLLRPERRAHHVGGGVVPVGVAVDGVVDQQVPGEHLAEDALALAAARG